MSIKTEKLRASAGAAAKEARAIAEKAGDAARDLTAGEKAEYDRLRNAAVGHLDALKAAQADEEILATARSLAAEIDGPSGNGAGVDRLALTGRGRKGAAAGIAKKMHAYGGDPAGRKALVETGSVLTPAPVTGDAVPLGRPATSVLDFLTLIRRESPTFKTMRQTTRTNNAGVVPAGGTKPQSVYSIAGVDNELQVVAHVSEPLDKYLLQDVANLERFIADEMLYGLGLAVEAEILNGDGTAGHIAGILATSGIQAVAAGADDVVTLRAALTSLEAAGHEGSVFMLNPVDWEKIETQRNTSGNFDLGGPVDRAARTVWGVPVVVSSAVTPRTAVVLDASAVAVDTDQQGIETLWDSSGVLFDKNQLKARTEGRFSVSVFQPLGVAEITLPAAA
jgi:HK97 family phage major capsid protein